MLLTKSRTKEVTKKNKSSLFLLPLISFDYDKDWEEFIQHGFINAYLGDDDYEIIMENCLFLLFNPIKFTTHFEWFCKKLRAHPLYQYEYDCPDNKYGKVIFVFSVSDIETLNVFKDRGSCKYSKVSKNYKTNFPKYNPDRTLSLRWKIFNKDPSLKASVESQLGVQLEPDAEYWAKFEPEDEILNYNKENSNYW